MRVLALAVILLASVANAFAETIDEATMQAVFALATRDYADPAGAQIRKVHKSKATNGLGYCGEVSLAEGEGFTTFHVILAGEETPASVLLLADFPEDPGSPNATLVRQMMVNFGCLP